MEHSEIVAAVRRYVTENFLYTRPDARLGDDDRLLENGVIDSMGVMELVGFLQDHFAIAVDERDITEEHFGSIGAIARYVVRRQSPSGPAVR